MKLGDNFIFENNFKYEMECLWKASPLPLVIPFPFQINKNIVHRIVAPIRFLVLRMRYTLELDMNNVHSFIHSQNFYVQDLLYR